MTIAYALSWAAIAVLSLCLIATISRIKELESKFTMTLSCMKENTKLINDIMETEAKHNSIIEASITTFTNTVTGAIDKLYTDMSEVSKDIQYLDVRMDNIYEMAKGTEEPVYFDPFNLPVEVSVNGESGENIDSVSEAVS